MVGVLGAGTSGFLLGISLIAALGAQSLFILQMGLLRQHVLALCTFCACADILLITSGVLGMGTIAASLPWVETMMTFGGAVYLLTHAVISALRATVKRSAGCGAADGMCLRGALLACAACTFLNPHVYLDTVVLMGTYASAYAGYARTAFAVGAIIASAVWFFSLGYGARLLSPLFSRPVAWRMLDAGIAAVMAGLGFALLASLHG